MSTMTEETTYNGWANYPTWCVNLWLSNDRGLYDMTLEAVQDEYRDAPEALNVREGIWTVEQARRFNTADRLRAMVEELGPMLGDDQEVLTTGFTGDLYGWALAQVDWWEIADAWLETADELAASD